MGEANVEGSGKRIPEKPPMTEPPTPSTSFSMPQAFFEAFFVLLGVGLALVANAWWEGRQQAKQTAVALAAIEAELQTNLATVRASKTYHDERLEMLYAWSDDEAPTWRHFPRGFIHAAQVLRSA